MNKYFTAKRSRVSAARVPFTRCSNTRSAMAYAPIALPLLVCLSSVNATPVQAQQSSSSSRTTSQPEATGPRLSLQAGKTMSLPLPPGARVVVNEGEEQVELSKRDGTLTIRGVCAGQAVITVQSLGHGNQKYLLNIRENRIETAAPQTTEAAPTTTTEPSYQAPSEAVPALPALSSPVSLPGSLSAPATTSLEPALRVSPTLPQPARLPAGNAPYQSNPPGDARVAAVRPRGGIARDAVPPITQGLARILSFSSNILAVFFSDTNVMDARAVTARTLAVTGLAPGKSTLAVFVSRYPGDAVGQAMIYNISIEPQTPLNTLPTGQDPSVMEAAIRTALNDPRIQVSVLRVPSGALAARLTGTMRDATEVAAAAQTARLFVPEVIQGIVTDPYAPTLAQSLSPQVMMTSDQAWQEKLRRITGNQTIELVPLPTGLAVKAEVSSTDDAEALLGILPALNQRVMPFIVVRGANGAITEDSATGNKYYGATRPILNGEDEEITRRLREVTGIRSVYIMRTAQNALAVYGTVRNRTEYDTVRRYALLLPQFGSLNANAATTGNQSVQVAGQPRMAGNGVPAAAVMRNALSPQNQALQYEAAAQVVPGGVSTGGTTTDATGSVPGSVTAAPGLPALPTTDTGVPTAGEPAYNVPVAGEPAQGVPTNPVPSAGLVNGFPQTTLAGGAPNYIMGPQVMGQPNAPQVAQAAGAIDPLEELTYQPSRANQPASGYRFPSKIQMFVRVLDGEGATVRRVTAETSIVEIRRDALRNLGVEAGSVSLLEEKITPTVPGTTTTVTNANGTTTTVAGGTPGSRDVKLGTTFNPGSFLAGENVLKQFINLDPLRARLNALYQRGNARILSQPNLTAVEGAEAQIVIGGERPVPSSLATGTGAVGQNIVFRRFGIILTMRPTLTDDDTIIMQIRADITSLSPETGINLNGALIPGENVRSIDTTMTVREGDIIVMGGLITNDRRESTSRVPLLSSIPILGNLFKSRRFENNETELAIVMTPHILRVPGSMNTREAVLRVPALPPLRDNQSGTAIFEQGGTRQAQ